MASHGDHRREDNAPQLSPDGRWLVYSSDQAGAIEIYIADFPGGTVRQRVSAKGGSQPRWRCDGRQLFYFSPGDTLTSVDIDLTTPPRASSLKSLFHATISHDPFASNYAVSKDGPRFLIIERAS